MMMSDNVAIFINDIAYNQEMSVCIGDQVDRLKITQKCGIPERMADRGIVVGNKIIYAKLKIKENKWMRNRLLSVQATVDNKTPCSFKPGGAFVNPDGSRRVNLKKIRLKKDRDRLINQNNGIMLRSISNIMRHNNIDTWASTRKYVPKMSNRRSRQRKMEYIRWENQILLKNNIDQKYHQTSPRDSPDDFKK